MSRILRYTGGPVACNAYLMECAAGWVLIDAPLGVDAWVAGQLPEGAGLSHVLLTHQHFDHVQGVAALLRRFPECRVHAHSAYSPVLTLEDAAAAWGIPPVEPFRVDDAFGSGCSRADWAGDEWVLYAIPGHSPDGMAYLHRDSGSLFVGDILFAGSVGRTDFPGGSMAQLVRGIRTHLMNLDPHTEVYSGHGPSTSIGEESLSNPYIA